MKLVILVLLGWLVVGFVVAIAIGKLIREVGRNVADDEYPDRRIEMRRASMKLADNVSTPPKQGERRRKPDRRNDDTVPRQRK